MMRRMINIFEYNSFKKFLSDYYEVHKKANKSFSYAVMAKNANISSRGLLKLIMDGKRKLSLNNIGLLTQGLSLNKSESDYFMTLVQFEQATNIVEKNNYYLKLMSFPQKRKISKLGKEQYNLYAKWYFIVLYEMTYLQEKNQTYEEFCQHAVKLLNGRVSLNEVKEAYEQLQALGLIINNQGRLQQSLHYFESQAGEQINFAMLNFHKEMMSQATEALNFPREKREFSGVTLAVKKSDLPRAKELIGEFSKKFNLEVSALQGAEAIYQLNIQFFELVDGVSAQVNLATDLNSTIDRVSSEI